jgi:hypothetical protein
MMAGQIGYWLLAVGYLHISTFNKKGATHEAFCKNDPRPLQRARAGRTIAKPPQMAFYD